ncbi:MULTISPECIES: cupin-like domain-containing protein [Nostoc]|uniref:Cupin-like domain-containing protein n=1 Tax=Nostoc paludosum FACHB-159 TaxID=2692908 RepID=A0ABR8K5C6_9NOSO|nr:MULTISPECIES: cupin-like domain-containing protein [Nostoc]MBD2677474.1 cupin-like domain-containing protein [Nostoc sp. FACHB-857]MBD2734133.1 cupin-like domain-containing protein [Nostoc paludosum FACHB-159]
MIISSAIERRYKPSTDEFKKSYVELGKPVIISGVISNWSGFDKWSLKYLKKISPSLNIYAKRFSNKEIEICRLTMKKYIELIESYEKYPENHPLPPYCHDLPLFSLIPSLIEDVKPFPFEYLPEWYWYKWWRYCQFFLGSSNSITPLHFDCLLTNNIFFQIAGRKQFTILLPEDAKYCYRQGWRWFGVNPENPDFNKYPDYKNARPITFIVNPGEILYMPPGTLHHVRSLDMSISFNIDWHTQKSSLTALAAIKKGMPVQNVYYNWLLTMGLVFKVPPQIIFKFYKSYLNYVS